ncbi:hypothetical protein AB1K56_08070 [Microbacterium sp. BWR-S6Y]|uniref:hypothetical protein n=1 Tax=Microbacterium sp. BWR-S6Y TaxID=3232073 RepID=UPI0035290735
MSDEVTCAWCHRLVEFGDEHGDGVCVLSVVLTADTSRLDAALVNLDAVVRMATSRFAEGVEEGLLSHLPDPDLRMPAVTPRVLRSPHVPSPSTAYVLDGSMFADEQLRVVLSESVSSEIADAVQAQLERRTREQDLIAWVERVAAFRPDGMPSLPVEQPVLLPWQREILARVASGEPMTIRAGGRSHGRSFVDRVLAEVCPACRAVGGHAPTCVTRVAAQLSTLTDHEKET